MRLTDGRHERVDVQGENSLADELDLFIAQKDRYASGWVPIRGGTSYVRYDQILEVKPVAS